MIFWLAYMPKGMLLQYNEAGDFSYGVYIYAFPVQQFIIHEFAGIGVAAVTTWTCLTVLPLAMISWHLVEKRALGMKGRILAKGKILCRAIIQHRGL